ncbi:hypothetical protein HYX13_02055, partial [Candidatus Woesearchaeota archaeon]|nr:hypothetical protein [Candidatus Woesearchaeota archaeon]
MKKNIFIFSLSFFIVLLFSLPLALAPCPDQENPSFCYDANAPENFDWQNGDYNSLNWDNQESIDYSKIDFTRVPSAYAYKVDVSKALAVGRGREVTSEILEAHLERGTLDAISLENLNKEYLSTAIKNKFGFTLNQLESGATFEGGVLRASYGSFAVAGKEGWAIDVNENGQILIVFPTKVTEEKISAEDTFTITEELDFLTAKGETLKVRQLSFRNGQAYVLVGDEAKIGDYLIPKQQSDVNVYFDVREAKNQEEKYGDYAGRNYMVITETSLDIYSQKGSEVVILPQPGNTLFGMVKRKYERDA